VPRRGGLLVFATHGGGPDFSYLVAAIPRPLRAVVLSKSLRQPVVGWILRLRGVYPVDAAGLEAGAGTMEALRRAVSDLRAGAAVGIYPQGVGDRVQGGAAWLAARAGVPVLPVFTYRIWTRDGNRRALVWIRRPVAPPGRRPSERRAFRGKLQRRMERAGASRSDRDTRAILDVVLDDRELWKDPRRVVRAAARVHGLPAAERRRLGRRARMVTRATRRLRCSPDALRRPPGWRAAAAAVLLAPAAWTGLALCAPPLLFAALRVARQKGRRAIGRHLLGTALAIPWGIALAAGGAWTLGLPGLLVPAAAAAGMRAVPVWKRGVRGVLTAPRIRRHRARFAPHLEEIEKSAQNRTSRSPLNSLAATASE